MSNTMHIAFCSDTNYVMPMGVAMISICENNQDCSIIFHLVITDEGTDLSQQEERLKPIHDIATRYDCELHLYSISAERLQEFVCSGASYISTTAFARIFLPDILPPNIDKVLYMDGDIAVNGSLLDLWNTPMPEDCPLGAVVDIFSNSAGQRYLLKIPSSIPYYNSGILLINLDCWRREKIGEQMVRQASTQKYPLLDQDVINVVLQGRILRLNETYNLQILFYMESAKFWLVDWTIVEEVESAMKNPIVIHYVSSNKPWTDAWCPKREIWNRYCDMSAWKGISQRHIITRFDRSSLYRSFIQTWWSDPDLSKEFIPALTNCIDAAVKLKNKRLFMWIATRPLVWMTWLLHKIYHLKTF